MSDAALFIALFGGLFVIRLIAATVVFLWILPDGDRCPCCDAETLRVESRGALKIMPWFRSSWCYECDWHGLHRLHREHRRVNISGAWSMVFAPTHGAREPQSNNQKPHAA